MLLLSLIIAAIYQDTVMTRTNLSDLAIFHRFQAGQTGECQSVASAVGWSG